MIGGAAKKPNRISSTKKTATPMPIFFQSLRRGFSAVTAAGRGGTWRERAKMRSSSAMSALLLSSPRVRDVS